MDSIQKPRLARQKEKTDAESNYDKDMDNLEILRLNAYAESVKKVIGAVSPDLITAMATQLKQKFS